MVGKAQVKNRVIMAKAKTKAWLDKVKEKFDDETAKRIIES